MVTPSVRDLVTVWHLALGRGARLALILGGILVIGQASAAIPPLLPFDNTADLFVIEENCSCILRITPSGVISIAVTKAEIEGVLGAGASVDDDGLAFDALGNLFFVVDSDIVKRVPNGTLTVVATNAAMVAAVGGTVALDGLAFGSDGLLYAAEGDGERLLRINPTTGATTVFASQAALVAVPGVTSVDLSGIVGGSGVLYVATEGDPQGVFVIDLASGTPSLLASGGLLQDLDESMTRAPNGDLIVADNEDDEFLRVTPAGVVSVFLSNAALAAVLSDTSVDGGIAFDAQGSFFFASETEGNIYRFNAALSGSVFVSAADITAVTGEVSVRMGAIAFGPGAAAAIPVLGGPGMAAALLTLMGIGAYALRARRRAA